MDELLQHGKNPLWEVLFQETPMQTFIQPNEADKTSFGCKSEEMYVTFANVIGQFFL